MRLGSGTTSRRGRGRAVAALSALVVAAVTACGAPGSPGTSEDSPADEPAAGSTEPVQIGLVYSATGPLATYGEHYLQGFEAGLDYATDGTGEIDGRPVEVIEVDDAGDPAKAVAGATDLIGRGVQVLAGSTASGVALQVAPLAEQNEVLFVSGPAAVDALTGINDYTFRSGRQTYQDILTAASFIGDADGQSVTVLAQDTAFGQANAAAVEGVLGGQGATVEAVLVPANATDITPFARQIADAAPDLVFVAWAGETATAMWQSLDQQGVFEASEVVTGLDISATYPVFGPQAEEISFLSHFFAGAAENEVATAMAERVTDAGAQVELFTPDGFVAAQMIVHALSEGGDDVDAMVAALEGWTFEGPKGTTEIRAEDHAMLQPMYQARLVPDGDGWAPEKVAELDPADTAPPTAGS